jgi:hypothetical protein
MLLAAGGCSDETPVSNAPFVPVLAYRDIVAVRHEASGDQRAVTRERFTQQMAFLADNGYSTATVRELAEYMRGERTLPPRSVVLTFDDAWEDAEEVAAILDRYGLEGTFFIGVDVATEGQLLALDWPKLKAIASNPAFEFGGQPGSMREGDDLVAWLEGAIPGRGPLDVVWQVEVTRQFLEMGMGRPVLSFAWPEGRISEDLVRLALKTGYTALLTRRQTMNHAGGDPLAIGRYPVLDAFGVDEFRKLVDGEVRADVAELLPEMDPVRDSVPVERTPTPPGSE